MAKFTRAEIRKIIGESCTDEIENQLVALHLGVVDPLKDDVTRYKADAEKLPGVQKELDDLKAQGDGGYKAKYEAEHKAFGDYKANVDAEKTTAAKEKALSDVLLKIGISEKRISSVARLAKGDGLLHKLELDDKGAIKDAAELEKSLKTDYGEYITKSSTKGADTSTPPANNVGKALTREDIYKTDDKGRYVLSTSERQAALVNLMQDESDD